MKNNQDSPKNVDKSHLRQKLLLVLCVVSMIPLFFAAKIVFSAFAQTKDKKEKVIKKYSFENEPIEFLEVKSDGKTVKQGEKFDREGDWLKDLTIKFKNISGKPITYVSIVIMFPETDSNGSPMVYFLNYGVNPLVTKTTNDKPQLLAPNDAAEVKLSAERFNNLKNFLLSRKMLSDLTEANFRIMGVFFEDGTQWSGGSLLRPDPDKAGKFILVENKLEEKEK